MNVIQRQSIKQTLVNYVAIGLAGVSTLFIYPLEEGLYGLWLTLYGMAAFFMPFASLGINSITIRFFPRFQDAAQDHRGFLPFLLGLGGLFYGVFVGLVLLSKSAIFRGLSLLRFDVSVIEAHLGIILVLTGILMVNAILTAYISNFQRIVVPGLLNQFWPKLALPALILMAWAGWLNLDQYILGLVAMQVLSVVGLLVYLGMLGELRLRPTLEILRQGPLREMANFGLFGMLGGLGSIFAFRLDHIMIAMLVNVGSTGIYGIAQFIGNSIEMPTRSIYAIAGPIIARAWEGQKLAEIASIYRKSSLNLLLLGLPLFGMIVLSLDDLFRLTAKYEMLSQVSGVVYLVGIGKLVDMACSVNGQIIGYSRYYRFNLVAILLLGLLNVVLNYLFIPRYGIVGAAIASFTSITAYNLLRSIFVWWRFGMQPFSWRTAVALGLASAATAIAYLIPDLGIPVVDMLQNSLLIGLLFAGPVLWLKLSPEVNALVEGRARGFRDMLGLGR